MDVMLPVFGECLAVAEPGESKLLVATLLDELVSDITPSPLQL